MRWQTIARLAIAAFVIVFTVIVALALRQRKQPVSNEQVPARKDSKSTTESGPGVNERTNKEGKVVYTLRFESSVTYLDGRTKLLRITLTLPDRNNRTVVVTADEGELVTKAGEAVGTSHLAGHVRLKTSDGFEVTAGEATYDETAGMLNVPGQVGFARGRMKGSGVGATYDRNRDVLWLLDQARVRVAADQHGQGALDATSGSAGLARKDHYVKFAGSAHLARDERVMEADEITVMLTEDDERARAVQLRANSRISGGAEASPTMTARDIDVTYSEDGGRLQAVQLRGDSRISGGANTSPAMDARDIDLVYGEDGRTLQHAQLVENGVLQLPGAAGAGSRRVAAKIIDLALAADGTTVTNLNAADNVQVDLPPDGDLPAKRIRSAALVASGGAGGLQKATFSGNAEYRESRAARRNVTEVNRTARALTLVVATKPGFGAIQEADFHGHVHFVDGTQFTADAAHALYHVERDQIDLGPFEGDPGPQTHVSDGRVAIDARTIEVTLTSRKLKADTRVRSSMQPERQQAPVQGSGAGARAEPTTKVPSMLKRDQPVNVTSNRLEYDGAAGHAVYLGHARLWQGDTTFLGDTIVVDDSTGNLEANGAAHTEMMLDDLNEATGKRTVTRTVGSADVFVYDDSKRLATYTMQEESRAQGRRAHLVGPQGDVTADTLELLLKPGANELDRAEGYGNVVVTEAARTVSGVRMTYTADKEQYFMTGTPVEVIDITPPSCKKSTYATITFHRRADTAEGSGRGSNPIMTAPIACPAGRQ